MTGPSMEEMEAQRREWSRSWPRPATSGGARSARTIAAAAKPNCACAQPDHRGHGPYLWTRTVAGRGTKGRRLSAGEVDKVRGELANYQRFAAVTEEIVAVNEAICEARPPDADPVSPPRGRQAGREKGALRESRRSSRRR